MIDAGITFLLVSLIVSVANLRIRTRTDALASIVLAGIIRMTATIRLLWFYLATNDPGTLGQIVLIYTLAFGAERSYLFGLASEEANITFRIRPCRELQSAETGVHPIRRR